MNHVRGAVGENVGRAVFICGMEVVERAGTFADGEAGLEALADEFHGIFDSLVDYNECVELRSNRYNDNLPSTHRPSPLPTTQR